jgi:AbrB family looped-hinge helix DNA binding protein
METTRLSTKGQIILPKAVRDARSWAPGTEFAIEETPQGVLLRPLTRFKESTVEEVTGCLKWTGEPMTLVQMRRGIARKVQSRHDSGRY